MSTTYLKGFLELFKDKWKQLRKKKKEVVASTPRKIKNIIIVLGLLLVLFTILMYFSTRNSVFTRRLFKANFKLPSFPKPYDPLDDVNVFENFEELSGDLYKEYDVVVVGAGLSGAVLGHLYASILKKRVLIIEKREHIAGNCYEFFENGNILTSKYGAHLFHTSLERVWRFVNKFSDWTPYTHRVVGHVDGQLVPIPINIDSVNSIFPDVYFEDVSSFSEWLEMEQTDFSPPMNGAEAAQNRVGPSLYEKVFKYYTIKQWDKDPSELDASVLNRIPLRTNWATGYFKDKYEYMPTKGFTYMVGMMLRHSNIDVVLNTDFFDLNIDPAKLEKLVYTGPIDRFFGYEFGELEYRSLMFRREEHDAHFWQSNSVVNYPQMDADFTRIVEYKHMPWNLFDDLTKDFPQTVTYTEFSSASGEPYYPVLNKENREHFQKYKNKVESIGDDVLFVGRLANYKYFNMDQAIDNAIQVFVDNNPEGIEDSVEVYLPSESEIAAKYAKDAGRRSVNFVVVRCKESLLSTVNLLQEFSVYGDMHWDVKFFIFDKCGMGEKSTSFMKKLQRTFGPSAFSYEVTELENVGREGYGYLFYMFFRTSQLGDINFFLQGEIETRCIHTVRRMLEDRADLSSDMNDRNIQAESFQYFNLNFVVPFFHWESDQNKRRYSSYFCTFYNDIVHEVVQERMPCQYPFGHDETSPVFATRGEFVATKNAIVRLLSRHRTVLWRIFNNLKNGGNDPLEGYFLEQLWLVLFMGVNPWNANNTAMLDSVCHCLDEDFCVHKGHLMEFHRNIKCGEVIEEEKLPACLKRGFSVKGVLYNAMYYPYNILYNAGRRMRDYLDGLKDMLELEGK